MLYSIDHCNPDDAYFVDIYNIFKKREIKTSVGSKQGEMLTLLTPSETSTQGDIIDDNGFLSPKFGDRYIKESLIIDK